MPLPDRNEGGSEYTGVMGPAGVPAHRPKRALSASDQARLMRLTGTLDPAAPISDRHWNGQAVEKSAKELEGERRRDDGFS
jgi:hypothetical protein